MVTSKRNDAYGIWYMPETTYGVDPGIVAAVNGGTIVNGTNETYLYIPTTSRPAYARLSATVEGLPRRKMVSAPQLFPVTDADPFMAKGTRSGGDMVSWEMLVHGGLTDTVGTDSDRPIPPPWLQLMTSASGRCIGHRAADTGGGNGATNNSLISGTPAPTADYWEAVAGAGSVGTIAPGHVLGVDHGTGTASYDIELVRPTRAGASDEFGESGGSDPVDDGGAVYSGVSVAFKQAPAENDRIYFSAQACFDRRFEDSGSFAASEGQLSYTVLILRPEVEACQILTGVRCNEWEITDNFDEIPKVKMGFHFKRFLTLGEDGSTAFGGTPTVFEEPAYYSNWPCPKVSSGNNMTFLLASDSNEDGTYSTPAVTRDRPLTGFSAKWNAGYTVRHSNMATESVEDLRQTQPQTFEVKFTTLYYDDWRDMLGLCTAVGGANQPNSVPFIYWAGENPRQVWFVASPALHLKADPGPGDTDFEGNMAQEIMLGSRPYRGDVDAAGTAEVAFTTTTPYQTKVAVGTI